MTAGGSFFGMTPRPSASFSLSFSVAAAALLALATVFPQPAAAQETPALPPDVVARVFGEDVTESQLRERLVRRNLTTDRGREILDLIVEDEIVAAEARRRGIVVRQEEVDAYVRDVEAKVKAQGWEGKTFDDVLAETKTTREEFLRTAREYLVRVQMARADYGMKGADELAPERLKAWVLDLRRRRPARTTGLPEGVLAQVDGAAIDRDRYGRELRRRLPVEQVEAVRAEIVLDVATRHAVQRAGVTVTDEEVGAQVARLRERFEKNPRARGTGLTFDAFLEQTFGVGEAGLRADPTFRSRVGLERMLSARISDDDVRSHWEANRLAWGERAMVRQAIFPASDERVRGSRAPSFREATDLALRAKTDILERAAANRGVPLGDLLAAVARENEPDPEARRAAGEPVAWTRLNVQGEPQIEKAAFEGALGTIQGPLRAADGLRLLLVEERRPAPSYDDVKGAVRDELLRMAVRRFQLELRTDGGLVVPSLR